VLSDGRLIQPPVRCAVINVLETLAHPADAAEAELMALVAAGDSGRPLRSLYHRYERRLYGFGFRLLGEQGLAEELVQETWVRLWQSASRFDPERGTVRAFLFTIARRVAADLYRRPSSRALAAEQEDAGAVEAAADQVCSPSPCATRWSRCRPPTARCSSWSTTKTSSWPTSPSGSTFRLGR
jgi:Sigma-70 region 2